MKLKSLFLIITNILLFGCISDSNETTTQTHITLNFNHYWDENEFTSTELNSLNLTNAFGNLLSIERLRYLISDIVLTKEDGQIIEIQEYNLTDISNEASLTYTPTELIEPGLYNNISFVFGLTNEKNSRDINPIDVASKTDKRLIKASLTNSQ